MKQIKKYYNKIVDWSKERKIIPNAKVLVQTAKMISEKSEISKAFLTGDYIELIDGIGDTFVTIVNVVELSNLQLEQHSENKMKINLEEANYTMDTSYLILRLDVLAGFVIDNIIKEKYNNEEYLNEMIQILHKLAKTNDTTLEECVETAYNEIKDRKGITLENGTFIKESDPRYKEIIKKILDI